MNRFKTAMLVVVLTILPTAVFAAGILDPCPLAALDGGAVGRRDADVILLDDWIRVGMPLARGDLGSLGRAD